LPHDGTTSEIIFFSLPRGHRAGTTGRAKSLFFSSASSNSQAKLSAPHFQAPGTGIYASKTEARNPPSAHPGDPETGALVKKARQWRANIANLQKVPDSQTAWWWMQSDANLSLPANWEMQGDFAEMQGEQ
jgi:hypothetical protein